MQPRRSAPEGTARAKLLAALLCVVTFVGATGATGRAAHRHGGRGVRVTLGSRVVGHFRSDSIRVRGLAARSVDVRLLGAIDMRGRAYQWAPYRWQGLRLRRGTWRGVLPAPVLLGIYQLQLRLDHGRKLLSNAHWLERVFPRGAEPRQSFATPAAVVRNYVTDLPGDKVLVAMKRWPLESFDHRDPRLHRLFVISYAPRNKPPSSRLGMWITTVREGFHGRWLLLEATVGPPD